MYFEDEKALGEFIMIAGYYHFKLKRFEVKNATIQLEHQDGTTLTITNEVIIYKRPNKSPKKWKGTLNQIRYYLIMSREQLPQG